jgi:hypothetical protein
MKYYRHIMTAREQLQHQQHRRQKANLLQQQLRLHQHHLRKKKLIKL